MQLSRLRDIGWRLWDPIGLLDPGVSWEGQPFADEYDRYLTSVASMLRDGHSTDECEAYLVQVAVVYMGMGLNRDGTIRPDREQTFRELATPTVAAIRAYAAELDANLDPPLSDTAQKS